jgi:hypothetical protein
LLSNLLENLGIRYYFFNALPCWYVFGDEMAAQIQTDFGSWLSWHDNHTNIQAIDSTMLRFVREHKFKIAPHGHPLVEAHAAWSDHLVEVLKDINIV